VVLGGGCGEKAGEGGGGGGSGRGEGDEGRGDEGVGRGGGGGDRGRGLLGKMGELEQESDAGRNGGRERTGIGLDAAHFLEVRRGAPLDFVEGRVFGVGHGCRVGKSSI